MDLVKCGFSREWATFVYFSDVSGRDWLSNIHKIGLQRLRLKRDMSFMSAILPSITPQWGAADAEIRAPFVENTELKRSPFKARGGSV